MNHYFESRALVPVDTQMSVFLDNKALGMQSACVCFILTTNTHYVQIGIETIAAYSTCFCLRFIKTKQVYTDVHNSLCG